MYLHILAIFDNDGKVSIVGQAITFMQDIETFSWVLKTFVAAADGIAPTCIFTDRDQAMEPAIIDALPNTAHLYCIWHLAKSLQKNLSSVLREEYQGFMNKFWQMQSINSMEQFTAEWESLLLTLPEAAVNYLKTWVTPLRNFANAVRLTLPTGGIQSTQGVEQVFGKLKRFVNKRSQVTQLADELHRFVGRRQKTKAANEVKAVKVNDVLDVGFRSFCERLHKICVRYLVAITKREYEKAISLYTAEPCQEPSSDADAEDEGSKTLRSQTKMTKKNKLMKMKTHCQHWTKLLPHPRYIPT